MLRQKFSGTGEVQSKHCEGCRITFRQRVQNGFMEEDAFEMGLEDGKNFYQRGTCISNTGRAWVLGTDEWVHIEVCHLIAM